MPTLSMHLVEVWAIELYGFSERQGPADSVTQNEVIFGRSVENTTVACRSKYVFFRQVAHL